MKLIRNDKKYKYDNKYIANIFLKGIDLELEKKQYVCVLKLIEFFDSYRIFNLSCYKYRRLQYEKPNKEDFKNDQENYYKVLLQHYIKNILLMIKEKKEK